MSRPLAQPIVQYSVSGLSEAQQNNVKSIAERKLSDSASASHIFRLPVQEVSYKTATTSVAAAEEAEAELSAAKRALAESQMKEEQLRAQVEQAKEAAAHQAPRPLNP